MHSCYHLTFISYDLKSSKHLDLVSIWSFDEFSSLYLRFLNIKPISYLTMVCYHQNPIRRTLGLTASLQAPVAHVVARGRFSLPAPSMPHDQHWAPFHAIITKSLLVAFELLLYIYLQHSYAVNLKIVFLPLLALEDNHARKGATRDSLFDQTKIRI